MDGTTEVDGVTIFWERLPKNDILPCSLLWRRRDMVHLSAW